MPFEEIAPTLRRSAPPHGSSRAALCRRVKDAAPVPDVELTQRREVVDAFFAAARVGDFDRLIAVLDPDVLLRSDGGTRRPDDSMVVRGADAVARRALMFANLFSDPERLRELPLEASGD